ncbi:hypothetical protein [Streptomyces sp. NPDC055506]
MLLLQTAAPRDAFATGFPALSEAPMRGPWSRRTPGTTAPPASGI